MDSIDQKFSSFGLLTFKFQLKFKKVLLFLQTIDDPELLFVILSYLDTQDLLSLMSTSKKLYVLRAIPSVENRILREKLRILQSPRQAFDSLSLLPAYYQFLFRQKQEDKQTDKIAQNIHKNFKQYKQYKRTLQIIKRKKQLAIKKNSPIDQILVNQKAYEDKIAKIQMQIKQGKQPFYETIQLATKPQKNQQKPKSYVQKFREEYSKMKEFERRKNIQELQSLHKKESEKIKIKGQIETPFKTIPIIEIKDDEKISVVSADSFYKSTASKYLNRVKAIMGLNIYS